MKSWKIPTEQQVSKALSSMVHIANIRYFFDRLENPEWLKPLDKIKYFNDPPNILKDDKRGTISFPPWPVSNYLSRMAQLKPQDVLGIILKIPENGNVRVYQDFIEALLKMPPEFAVKLNNKVKNWINSPYRLIFPEKLGELILHYAKGGFIDDAFELAETVFIILPGEKPANKPENSILNLPTEPRILLEIYDYEQTMKKYFPEFLNIVGVRGFEFLCKKLDTAIYLSRNKNKEDEFVDYSHIWRPTIEPHEQNIRSGIKNILIDAIRDSAEKMISENISNLPKIICFLDCLKKKVFLRIKLHIFIKFGYTNLEKVASILTDTHYFDDHSIRHEFVLLIRTYFQDISEDKQKFILGLIEKGPDLSIIKKNIQEWKSREPTESELAEEKQKWQLLRLSWIKDYLPEKYKDKFLQLSKKYGEPKHPDFISYGVSWVGPVSPKKTEELEKMSPDEIMSFLENWIPSEDLYVPSPDGLGRTLIEVIKNRADLFSSIAIEFIKLDPTYVRSFIEGLTEAVKENKTLHLEAVLELCSMVANQPYEFGQPKERKYRDKDPDWGWTRKSIANLLQSIFIKDILPYKNRDKSWQILKILTEDPEPSQAYEKEYGGTNMDPATLSINTVRGVAMHTLFQYALWVRRCHEKLTDAKNYKNMGFDAMPEVKEVLDKHLIKQIDPSLAIRSVYGRWLPWLALLDEGWLIDSLPLIFPSKEDELLLRDAAWESYVVFCRPFDNMLPIISKQYNTAIHRLEIAKELHGHFNPNDRLAEHLMEYYWRGKLDFDNYNGLFTNFWNIVDYQLKGYALEFLGQSLKNTKETISPNIINRLKQLWEKRLFNAKMQEDNNVSIYEMRAFEWWFISEKFENDWAIKQLQESLYLSDRFNMHLDEEIVSRLTEFSKTYPVETIKCLELIAKSDEEGWGIHLWSEKAKLIISEILKTNASGAARSLINYLGTRGYFGFRDLLKS